MVSNLELENSLWIWFTWRKRIEWNPIEEQWEITCVSVKDKGAERYRERRRERKWTSRHQSDGQIMRVLEGKDEKLRGWAVERGKDGASEGWRTRRLGEELRASELSSSGVAATHLSFSLLCLWSVCPSQGDDPSSVLHISRVKGQRGSQLHRL